MRVMIFILNFALQFNIVTLSNYYSRRGVPEGVFAPKAYSVDVWIRYPSGATLMSIATKCAAAPRMTKMCQTS